ncbi:hypothetical protein [Burkholderia latens]|uniref:hypothetical protein n=1 Tax=Burkholderia latens TaxID=488446 RepID=UPI001AEAFBFB|nr:hypothetical protein [Burkholderia latens]QTO46327.1 hypothetical protein J8I85_17930 [Burkholderia latens]
MIDWKPIETLKFHPVKCSSRELRSEDVILWVKSEYGYSGPVIGMMLIYQSQDGSSFKSVDVNGVSGYDLTEDFSVEDVTHWAELPKGPGEE